MEIEIGKFNFIIDWKAIAIVTGAIVLDVLSKRGQLNTLNIDMRNQRLSLNQ
jgi:hypothetical protein